MSKLSSILAVSDGWDLSTSKAADRNAVANYAAWSATVPAQRLDDAEPMLTDEGHIRVEWTRGDNAFTAEIGPSSMWLCILAKDAANDADLETVFDPTALNRFFTAGILPIAQ